MIHIALQSDLLSITHCLCNCMLFTSVQDDNKRLWWRNYLFLHIARSDLLHFPFFHLDCLIYFSLHLRFPRRSVPHVLQEFDKQSVLIFMSRQFWKRLQEKFLDFPFLFFYYYYSFFILFYYYYFTSFYYKERYFKSLYVTVSVCLCELVLWLGMYGQPPWR